ncbi:MAG TPA: PEP-CTERM sorting domain-containing protein [Fimbriimonadaceae bacterium]|nr:PEP-CTERM sorting domain-containing protein [Fimbriimonadaceae bacterium]
MHKVFALLGLAGTCLKAGAQSFNIDLDVSGGGPLVGQGVPSAAFGAASGQTGFWNRISSSGHNRTHALLNLQGASISATMRFSDSGGGGGSGWVGNTGDHRLLMNDYTSITIPCTVTFSGLLPGRYTIYTYGADALGRAVPLEVRVPGAVTEVFRSGLSPATGNQFVLGVTHTIHHVLQSASTLQVILSDPISDNPPDPSVNGFQLVHTPVPEPSIWLGLALGLLGITRFRRK